MAGANRNIGNRMGVGSLNASISRGGFVRTAGVAAAGLGMAAAGLGSTVNAIGGDEPWDNKIYPTGIAQTDWRNIQDAVNRGGVVRLMYQRGVAFNLEGMSVEIKRDVKIIGQRTRIKFANAPVFSCSLPVRLSIANIRFADLGRVSVSPLNISKPAQGGSVSLDLSSVAIGGDEPWD